MFKPKKPPKLKHWRNLRPRTYPILPREKRVKRVREERPTQVVSAVKYDKRMFSARTTILTGLTSTWTDSTASITAVNISRTFQKNKDWRQEVARGADATYPYNRSVAAVKPLRYTATTRGSGYISQSYGTVGGQATVNPLPDTDLQEIASGRLKNRLSGYIGNASVMAPLAEAREIGRLVRQINGLGLSVVKSALAIRKTKGRSALAQFGDIWLGFGFGINPMLKDIEKAANAITDYQLRDDNTVRVSGTASRDYFASAANSPGAIAFGSTLWVNTTNRQTQSVRIVAGIKLKLKSSASYSVYDHLGLKISEIPSTLWELTPYSWAVDYFTTVSPWIDDVFYTLPGVATYVSMTRKYQNEASWTLNRFADQAGFKTSANITNGGFRYASITRSKLSLLPTRSLRFKSTDEIAKYGLTKFLNLASVLAGRHGPKL